MKEMGEMKTRDGPCKRKVVGWGLQEKKKKSDKSRMRKKTGLWDGVCRRRRRRVG